MFKMIGSFLNLNWWGTPDHTVQSFSTIPTSGAHTMDELSTLDISGGTFGGIHSINPASGLPTVAGDGTPDIAGNSWGTLDMDHSSGGGQWGQF
ncbi:hypothetical protein [Ketogulonicigenium robustum]|uniref:hypothetical protein n=1 Tax=Ketogulonicigenium robustum TaxID=92947 RepID=UPI0012F51FC2|nr:hypothetical protein [Ketogulonicigenium robustum]